MANDLKNNKPRDDNSLAGEPAHEDIASFDKGDFTGADIASLEKGDKKNTPTPIKAIATPPTSKSVGRERSCSDLSSARAYTLSDRGTWLSFKNKGTLVFVPIDQAWIALNGRRH
jgi:ABC-type tungstate transport system permease subunit